MYYFENKEKQNELKDVLEGWVGTPFRHHCHVKGMGCDCIGLPIGVYKELGILNKDFKVPDYARDWHLHKSRELLLEGVRNTLSVDDVELKNIKNGDLVLYRFGKASAHIGIYCDNYLYHSIIKIGVMKLRFKPCLTVGRILHLATHILRIKEKK